MNKIFRPFDSQKPFQCFSDVALTLAISALITAAIIIGVALWAIFHPPKFHQANYAAYYSATEYQRLTKELDNPPLSRRPAVAWIETNNSSSVAARPVDAER